MWNTYILFLRHFVYALNIWSLFASSAKYQKIILYFIVYLSYQFVRLCAELVYALLLYQYCALKMSFYNDDTKVLKFIVVLCTCLIASNACMLIYFLPVALILLTFPNVFELITSSKRNCRWYIRDL